MIRRVLCLIALVGFPGCVTNDNTENELSSLESQPDVPQSIKSVEEWDNLDKDARLAVIEKEYKRFPNLKLTDAVAIGSLQDPQQKAFAQKMAEHMRANGNMEVEDQSHAKIGAMKIFARVLLLDGKTILGGSVQFIQQGCDMPDESTPTFASVAEAEAANCETAPDALWSAYGTFNRDGVPIESGDFMEWRSL